MSKKDSNRKDKVYNAMNAMMTGKAKPTTPAAIKQPVKKAGRGK